MCNENGEIYVNFFFVVVVIRSLNRFFHYGKCKKILNRITTIDMKNILRFMVFKNECNYLIINCLVVFLFFDFGK